MRTRVYDSVTPGNIPADAELVGGYVDGWYRWPDGAWNLFPAATPIRIAVWPSTDDGNCLDVEPGDASPDQAPGWVLMRQAAGQLGSVYCSDYQYPQVAAAFAAVGMDLPPIWRAAYPGIGQAIYPGDVAHQWGGDSDGGYDISVAVDAPGWPGVDSGAPIPSEEEEAMVYFGLTVPDTGLAVLDAAGVMRWCASFADYAAFINGLRAVGAKVVETTVSIQSVKSWEAVQQVQVTVQGSADATQLAAAVQAEVTAQLAADLAKLKVIVG